VATKSARFAASWQSNVTFTVLGPRRLLSLQAYNGGSADATLRVTCSGQPTRQLTLGAGQRVTLETGWSQPCSRVTLFSSNGWLSYFDNIVLDGGGGPAATPTATQTPTSTLTRTPTATPTPTGTPTQIGGPPAAGERLINGGFENGLASWERPSWFANVADVEATVVHTGARAFRFNGRGTGVYLKQEFAAAGQQQLRFSGWVSVPGYDVSGGGIIELIAYNTNRGQIARYRMYTIPASTEGYVPVSGSITAPQGTARVRLRAFFPNFEGIVYLDDLSVQMSE
jgi:hypothetical protein